MQTCRTSHTECKQYGTKQTDHSGPARLLDLQPVQQGHESGIRLVATSAGKSYHYACLSDRWDDAVKTQQTTMANVEDRLAFLGID
jgi:hypothetical protein